MTMTAEAHPEQSPGEGNGAAVGGLAVLLGLRVVVVQVLILLVGPLQGWQAPAIELAYYLLLVTLIVRRKSDLAMDHVDRLSVVLFAFSGIVLTLAAVPRDPSLITAAGFSAGTAYLIIRIRGRLSKPSPGPRSMLLSLLAGATAGISMAFVVALVILSSSKPHSPTGTPAWT